MINASIKSVVVWINQEQKSVRIEPGHNQYIRYNDVKGSFAFHQPLIEDYEELAKRINKRIRGYYRSHYQDIVGAQRHWNDEIREELSKFPYASQPLIPLTPQLVTGYLTVSSLMGRFFMETLGSDAYVYKDKSEFKLTGLSYKVIESILVRIPENFEMLLDEAIEILKELQLDEKFRSSTYYQVVADDTYGSKRIFMHLYQTDKASAEAYFRARFISDTSGFKDISGIRYEPFDTFFLRHNKDDDCDEFIISAFGKISKIEAPLNHNFLYPEFIFFNGSPVPSVEEEQYYIEKNKSIYDLLPDKFILDGKIITKNVDAKRVPTIFLSIKFPCCLSASNRQLSLSMEGFVLTEMDAYGFDMVYIASHYQDYFEGCEKYLLMEMQERRDLYDLVTDIEKKFPFLKGNETMRGAVIKFLSGEFTVEMLQQFISLMYQLVGERPEGERFMRMINAKPFALRKDEVDSQRNYA